LIKDPDGAYSQLIRLQQDHTKETHEVTYVAGSGLQSKVLSLEQSIGDSPRNRRQQSLKSHELHRSNSLHGHVESRQEHEVVGDNEAPKKTPIGRLLNLSKPEAPILLLAVIAAFVHGLLFPSFSIMMTGGIRSFYYPAHQLRKDSTFWALMCLFMAIICLVSIQLEYFLFGIAGGKLIERVRALSFQSIVHQEIAWFDDPSNSRFSTLLFSLEVHLFPNAMDIKFYF
jgi:ATP-binding cassette subfamily B (MDR/TAP) protein 1